MTMLADFKRRQKYSTNPNGLDWSKDNDKLGQRMLQGMGWTKGKGLGANEDGNVDCVAVLNKNDNRGVGCTVKHADNWIAHQDDFNALLSQLNAETSNSNDAQITSLEEKSKVSKGRLHYQKFTRGKDLSRAKQDDLNSIFGRRKSASAPVTPLIQSKENSACNSETEQNADDNLYGVQTTTSSSSVQEYFAQKMAMLKQKSGSSYSFPSYLVSTEPATQYSANNDSGGDVTGENARVHFTLGAESDTEASKDADINTVKKKKKSKKNKEKKSEECDTSDIVDTEDVNMQVEENSVDADEVVSKKKKKKSKKNKTETVDKNVESPVVEQVENEELSVKKKNKKKKKSKEEKCENLETQVVKEVGNVEESTVVTNDVMQENSVDADDVVSKKKKRKSKKNKTETVDDNVESTVVEQDEELSVKKKNKKNKKRKEEKHVNPGTQLVEEVDNVEESSKMKKSKKRKPADSDDNENEKSSEKKKSKEEDSENLETRAVEDVDNVEESSKKKKSKKRKHADSDANENEKSSEKKKSKDTDSTVDDKTKADLLSSESDVKFDKTSIVSNGEETNCPTESVKQEKNKTSKDEWDNSFIFAGSTINDIKGYGNSL